MANNGNLYIIAAPSGAGKTTLVKALALTLSSLTISISHTTRAMRQGEVDGSSYYFIDKSQFERMIEQGDFLEHATIFGNLYGTSKRWVDTTLASGTDIILEIDWQGHRQIKQLFPESIGIFILPPSLNDLRDRLVNRNQDHADIIEKRLADVRVAVSHAKEFEYLVINDTLEHALHELQVIVEAGRLSQARQAAKFAPLLSELTKPL